MYKGGITLSGFPGKGWWSAKGWFVDLEGFLNSSVLEFWLPGLHILFNDMNLNCNKAF
jgi:hypothetical protein